jgi:hypothetical protein
MRPMRLHRHAGLGGGGLHGRAGAGAVNSSS